MLFKHKPDVVGQSSRIWLQTQRKLIHLHRLLRPAEIEVKASRVAVQLVHPWVQLQCLLKFHQSVLFAPELLRAGDRGRGAACDWWAFGCVLYELRSGRTPFHAAAPRELFRRILRDAPDPVGSKELRALTGHLLRKAPGDRATAADVARAQFFTGIDWRAAASRGLKPPLVPDAPSFLESNADGDLRFAGDPARQSRRERLATPRRVTFDEENASPATRKSLATRTVATRRAAKRTFRGFALPSNVDLAASPATYRRATDRP